MNRQWARLTVRCKRQMIHFRRFYLTKRQEGSQMDYEKEAKLKNENRDMREALRKIHDLAVIENYSLSDQWFNTLNEAFELAEMDQIEREILVAVGF